MPVLNKKTLKLEEFSAPASVEPYYTVTDTHIMCNDLAVLKAQALKIVDADLAGIDQLKIQLEAQRRAALKKRREILKWH